MKVVTFGELMLRLCPTGHLRFNQSNQYQATFGGAEANVAVSLANFGMDAEFVSKLPMNEIGNAALNSLRQFGVNTDSVIRDVDRVGIYYYEKGASQRPSKVIYDRKNSSFALSKKEDYDWNKIFERCDWFHFTGITPALSDELSLILLEACEEAKKRNITISCDLNFRKKLWSNQKANEVMSKLCQYVDICIANEEDAKDVFNIEAKDTQIEKGQLNKEGYISVAKQLQERFNFKAVAITLRESFSADDNDWSAMLYQDDKAYFSKTYHIHIVDRVGGGDSFGAGLIYAFKNNMNAQEAIEFAVAASCLKHSIEGDYNMVSVDEVKALMNGNASGRVQR